MAYDPNYSKGGGGGQEFMQPINERAYEIIKASEGPNSKISMELASQFFVMTVDKKGNPKPIILKAGLIHKMDETFGKNNYEDETDNLAFIDPQAFEAAKKQAGYKEGDLFIMYRSDLYLPGKTRPIRTYGEVNKDNVKGNKHPFALAETRARNRAMRLATKCGFSSLEETYDPEAFTSPMATVDAEERRVRTSLQILLRDAHIPKPTALKFYEIVTGRRGIQSSTELNTQELRSAIDYITERLELDRKKPEVKKTIERWAGNIGTPKMTVTEESGVTVKESKYSDAIKVCEKELDRMVDEVMDAEIVTLPFSEPPPEHTEFDEADMFIAEELDKEQDQRASKLMAVEHLFTELQWDKEKQTKLLMSSTAKAETADKMTSEQLDSLINHLNKQLKKA